MCHGTTPSRQPRRPHPEPPLHGVTARLTPRSRRLSGRIPFKSPHRRRAPHPPAAQAQHGARSGPCSGIWASGAANLSVHLAHTDTLSLPGGVPARCCPCGQSLQRALPRGDTREASGAGSHENISYGCSKPYLETRCPALNSGGLNKLARVWASCQEQSGTRRIPTEPRSSPEAPPESGRGSPSKPLWKESSGEVVIPGSVHTDGSSSVTAKNIHL